MKSYYPYIYGAIAGALTFIAMVYICLHSFAMTTAQSVIWGVIGFILVGASSSYTEYAIAEVQRIADKYHMDDEFLAKLTGMRQSYFKVASDHLNLVAPRYLWPKILKILKKYEKERDNAENFHL